MRYGWLNRIFFFAINFFFVGIPAAYACSVCFGGVSDDPANVSLRNGVIFLLGIVLLVLAFFAKFFVGIRKRTKFMMDQSS